MSYHPPTPVHDNSQWEVDLDKALVADIPGFASNDAKDIDVIMDAYIAAAHFVRQTCLLQIYGPMVKTPMVHFLEEIVASLVCLFLFKSCHERSLKLIQSRRRIDAYASFSAAISNHDDIHHVTSQGRHSETQLLLEIIMTIEELQSFLFVLDGQMNVISQMQKCYMDAGTNQNISEKALPLLSKTLDDVMRIKRDVDRLVKNMTQIQAAVKDLFHQ